MKNYYPSYVTSSSHKIFVKVILRIAIVQNVLQIWMPKLVYSLYLSLDNIKNVFFQPHDFDFTAPSTMHLPEEESGRYTPTNKRRMLQPYFGFFLHLIFHVYSSRK